MPLLVRDWGDFFKEKTRLLVRRRGVDEVISDAKSDFSPLAYFLSASPACRVRHIATVLSSSPRNLGHLVDPVRSSSVPSAFSAVRNPRSDCQSRIPGYLKPVVAECHHPRPTVPFCHMCILPRPGRGSAVCVQNPLQERLLRTGLRRVVASDNSRFPGI